MECGSGCQRREACGAEELNRLGLAARPSKALTGRIGHGARVSRVSGVCVHCRLQADPCRVASRLASRVSCSGSQTRAGHRHGSQTRVKESPVRLARCPPRFCASSASPSALDRMTRPLTPRHPEPLFLHAPRPGPQARWFRRPLASQAMWLYVLCLCVRHGPPTSQVRGLHGFRPGVDPGHGDYDPCL